MVKNLNHIFDPRPRASFLESKGGIVNEIKIEKTDVMSFGQVCEENVRNTQEDIVKVIYLRRHYEILNDKGMVYHLLSSLLHKREFPTIGNSVNGSKMSEEAIEKASTEIEKKIENFSYSLLLTEIKDRENLLAVYRTSRNNYEKLQLFRMANENNHQNNIISKFINETFHIENEYIMQLNPCKYDFIPDFIIDECNKSLFGI